MRLAITLTRCGASWLGSLRVAEHPSPDHVKVSVHTGMDGNERADEAAPAIAAPDAVKAHSQPRGYTGRMTT